MDIETGLAVFDPFFSELRYPQQLKELDGISPDDVRLLDALFAGNYAVRTSVRGGCENCAQTVPKHPELPLTEPHGTASASPLSHCKRCIFNSYRLGDRDSKSAEGNLMGVRPPLPAPRINMPAQ